ncbi:putative short-chain dehydrogenase [Lepidopterella palustris CBS 459.81]|uniref:Putative short-chain dehydrogenase n=1 Tax=Lepidopterella palustris CBS 459.81 TaxID=1314670 RepID=A0A8E2JKN6_9PEZI|nr:putative short-chain dehydrogenase [Lepidopterella palustris CBS 459.81]
MSFGDLLALVDKTILNPWLTAPCVLLRVNRALSRKALNNGVNAKFDWSKEIILITGAAGGIGAEAAKKLAARGSTVVVLDVLPLTYPKPGNLHYFKCDLTNYDAVQAVGAQISKEIGDPTCVVANAGICRGKPILEATKRDIELTFSVNSLGLLWTAKTFLPSMAQRNHGHFLIIASQTGHLATAGVVDYAATKSAAIAIYEGLQTEMKHTYKAPAVRVSCLSPSAVNTKMFAGIKGPSNFFMPRLTPDGVGETIAQILWSGEAQNLLIPAFAYISPPTRALPEWLRVGMQDGGSQVMTELNPHKPLD